MAEVLNGRVTWLGDGTQIVAVPAPFGTAFAAWAPAPATAARNSCGRQISPAGVTVRRLARLRRMCCRRKARRQRSRMVAPFEEQFVFYTLGRAKSELLSSSP